MPNIYCKNGDHHWERPSKRGAKPLSCPEHQETEKTKAEKAEKRLASLAKARATRQRNREAAIEAQRQQDLSELAELRGLVDAAHEKYATAFDKAASVKDVRGLEAINKAFDRADNAMSQAQGIQRRITILEKKTS